MNDNLLNHKQHNAVDGRSEKLLVLSLKNLLKKETHSTNVIVMYLKHMYILYFTVVCLLIWGTEDEKFYNY